MFYTLSMCLFLKIISHTNFLSILEKHPGFAASLSLLIRSVTISHMFLQDTPASFPLKAVSNILLISSFIFKWDLKYYPLQPNNKLIKRAWDWEFSHKQKRCFGLFRGFIFSAYGRKTCDNCLSFSLKFYTLKKKCVNL